LCSKTCEELFADALIGFLKLNVKIIQIWQSLKKLGVLTSGGDAPGMNAAIRAVTRACNL